jgi:3-hydroxyisobutyrate dehydrogenase-like beta-hydroxyacid dehydrogenase
MKTAMPVTGLVAQLFNSVQALGLSDKGTHALMLALERINRPG